MKTAVTFKAITYRGKVVCKTIRIEHDFQTIPPVEIQGVLFPETSVERQVMEYLDEMDKRELMEEREWSVILDYWIASKHKKRKDELLEFIEFCRPYIQPYPVLWRQFEATVSESKDILFGHNKSNVTKYKEVFNIMKITDKALNGLTDVLLKRAEAIVNEDDYTKLL